MATPLESITKRYRIKHSHKIYCTTICTTTQAYFTKPRIHHQTSKSHAKRSPSLTTSCPSFSGISSVKTSFPWGAKCNSNLIKVSHSSPELEVKLDYVTLGHRFGQCSSSWRTNLDPHRRLHMHLIYISTTITCSPFGIRSLQSPDKYIVRQAARHQAIYPPWECK